ncbi:glycerophosphodiester phosphodiesterase family protein [Pseudoalteromonas umbrosa]|uniref:glycerophosphodiester phosphodiesterase family protein n=1 Tax=Pseudoalteromonas umbrosa TaxID=3048489 RepID=UPI0024C29E3A|nr:glycerophosphodiester phosphodiesterase family protein [Pseudoalteromonas sp. B95]MDK1289396.1 glycerophosphodiester phosphodiesterase family protein [Pseudoalteromonas sp. B95]
MQFLTNIVLTTALLSSAYSYASAQLGPRPFYLVDQMAPSALKTKLSRCANRPAFKSNFSIGHRGAPTQFPEHTKESYVAAARMGAGVLECDVTFTKDKELVCRHAQCDLHTSTDILLRPELAAKCNQPFTPANPDTGAPASAKCCTSDLTLDEFMQLRGKMDGANPQAQSPEQYVKGTAGWRTDLYSATGTLMTHAQSIELFKSLRVKMTPELKAPAVDMPFEGMTQQDYAQKMIDEYRAAGVSSRKVLPQSFNIRDVQYWRHNTRFGKQGVYLDGRYSDAHFNPNDSSTWQPSMRDIKASGINIIAPPLWVLLTLDAQGNIVPSQYAKAAKAANLDIITWTLERSGLISQDGGWYYQGLKDAISNEGDVYKVLDVLAKQVGVKGVFSDWPATTTFYANCMNIY